MLKKFVHSIVALFVISSCTHTIIGHKKFPKSIPTKRVSSPYRSIVALTDTTGALQCEGVFLSPETLLTSSYCARNEFAFVTLFDHPEIRSINLFLLAKEKDTNPETQASQDAVIFVFPEGTGSKIGIKSYPGIATTQPEPEDRVFYLGFDWSEENTSIRSETELTALIYSTPVRIIDSQEGTIKVALDGFPHTANDKEPFGIGAPGSPLFNHRGEVVGLAATTDPFSRPSKGKEAPEKSVYFFNTSHGNPEALALYRTAIGCNFLEEACATSFKGSGVK